MKKAILVLICMAVATTSVLALDGAVEKNCKASITKLEKALKRHNFGLVEDLFHEDFDYAGLGCGGHCSSSKMVVSMVVSTYPHKVKNIDLKDVRAEGPDYKAVTNFTYHCSKDDVEKEAEFAVLMTGEGEFLGMEFPGIKLQLGGPETAQQTQEPGCGGGSCETKGDQ